MRNKLALVLGIALVVAILVMVTGNVGTNAAGENVPAKTTSEDASKKNKIRITTVKLVDDIGITATEWEKNFKAAYEVAGFDVVEEAGKYTDEITIIIGKDDNDDDDDGKADASDTDDYGDGTADAEDDNSLTNLDEVMPDLVKDYPNTDDKQGTYIYIFEENMPNRLYTSIIDSLKEKKPETANSQPVGNPFFQKARFSTNNKSQKGGEVNCFDMTDSYRRSMVSCRPNCGDDCKGKSQELRILFKKSPGSCEIPRGYYEEYEGRSK